MNNIMLRTHRRPLATILFTALYTTMYAPVFGAPTQEPIKIQTPETVYSKLADYHLPSLAHKSMAEERANEARKKTNAEKAQQKNIKDVEIPTLGEVEKLKLSYHLLGLLDGQSTDKDKLICHESIKDLELLCGPGDLPEHHLFGAVDNTVTAFGKIELQKMLLTPLTDTKTLEQRQQFVKKLIEDETLFNQTQTMLEKMKANENDVVWFWKSIEEEVEQFFNQLYYGKFLYFFDLSGMNKNSAALQTLHSWQTVVSPALAITWPLLIQLALTGWMKQIFDQALNDRLEEIGVGLNQRADFNAQMRAEINRGTVQEIPHELRNVIAPNEIIDLFNQDFTMNFINVNFLLCKLAAKGIKHMSWNAAIMGEEPGRFLGWYTIGWISLCYIWPLVATLRNAANVNKVSSLVHGKMIKVGTFTNTLHTMGALIAGKPELANIFPGHQALLSMNTTGSAEAKELVEILQTDTFKGQSTPLALKGRMLAAYKMMHSAKDNLTGAFQAAGTIDACMAIAKLYKKSMNNTNATWCFAEYKNGTTTPYLELENYWHPILDPNRVVTNSIAAGLTNGAGNVIITGPNAGGKSTALKAISLAILLAQTFGIAPAKKMVLTPFAKFKTHLNIVDSEGRESLFQAEMRRAQDLITDIRRLKANEFSFTILDEIFTGTNPEEGQAGAYGVAKNLSQFTNSMCFVATHYKKLTELDTATNGRYKNYKVSVIIHDTGAITPTYTLTPGVSDQKIALQLLQNAGFGSDILDAAHEVMNTQRKK